MTLTEVIKISQAELSLIRGTGMQKRIDAVKLNIEAMKRLIVRRGFGIPADLKLLPGETEEDDS